MYGRDPQLPTSVVSDPPVERDKQDIDDYKSRLSVYMDKAWETARACVQRAQKQQKVAYDRRAKPRVFKPGDRVFVFMPGAKQTKFTRAFHGPYRVKEVLETGVLVQPVDRPNQESTFDRVRYCPQEIKDEFWPPRKKTTEQVAVLETDPTRLPFGLGDFAPAKVKDALYIGRGHVTFEL